MKLHTSFRLISMVSAIFALLSLGCGSAAMADFGAAPFDGGYYVTNGANLAFYVNDRGDIRSCKYKGVELLDPRKPSGIASGLGASTVTANVSGDTILITCYSTTVAPTPFTHYYIVKNGVDAIYMADYVTSEPHIGELRYILRTSYDVLPNGPPHSNNSGTTGNIESKDIFGHPGGLTSSKYYGNIQDRNLTVNGATGNGVGVFMAYGSRESSSGGPFYRDIMNQGDGAGNDQEIYNYMNSGHNQIEEHRVNVLYGPYAYVFTDGTVPTEPDFSFIAGLGLQGFVPDSGRGSVAVPGITGRAPGFEYMVAFSNAVAQYWTAASPTDGSCVCSGMKPGAYTMAVYKGELPVWIGSATVTAGTSSALKPIAIVNDPGFVQALWRIGDWDGTPLEFNNGTLINLMHPSDVRMKPWGPVVYNVGSSQPSTWPAIQFRDINSPSTIDFSLTAAQAASPHIFKLGITEAYAGGRPIVVVNGNRLDAPPAVREPKSRSFTTGSYRGYCHIFSLNIPASDFVAGTNTITISAVSSTKGFTKWLSPSFCYDCVELD